MLYEYWRNDHLQAYAFSAITKNKLRWNNFGGNIGGPVIIPHTRFNNDREKLFFFYSEDLKYMRTGAPTTWTVPTAAFKSGNFGTTRVNDPDNGGVRFPTTSSRSAGSTWICRS